MGKIKMKSMVDPDIEFILIEFTKAVGTKRKKFLRNVLRESLRNAILAAGLTGPIVGNSLSLTWEQAVERLDRE
jgi:hypothetical protein